MASSKRRLTAAALCLAALTSACGGAAAPSSSVAGSSPAVSPAASGGATSASSVPKPVASAGTSAAAAKPSGASSQRPTVSLGYSGTSINFLPLFLAKDAGTFDKAGLNLNLLQMPTASQVAALTSNQIQFMVSISAVAGAAEKGLPVRTLGSWLEADAWEVVARPDISRADQLAGKTIGVNQPGIPTNTVMAAELDKRGLKASAYHTLNTPTVVNRIELLLSGKLDAVLIDIASAQRLIDDHYNVIVDLLGVDPYPVAGLGATLTEMKQDPAMIRASIGAMSSAVQLAATDENETVKVMAPLNNIPEADAHRVFAAMKGYWRPDMHLSQVAIQNLAQFDYQEFKLPRVPTADQIYDFSFLPPATSK